METELLEIGERTVRKAEQLGADEVEAYLVSSKSISIDVKNNFINSAAIKRDKGCGIRSVIRKTIGYAYVTSVLEQDIFRVAEKSVALAKAAVPDPDFVGLPSYKGSYHSIDGLIDKKIVDLRSEEAADIIKRTVEATKDAVGGMKVAVEAKITSNHMTRAVVNSLGISKLEESTFVSLYSEPTVKTSDSQTSSYEFQVSRDLKEIDPNWIGKTAGENAIKLFNPKTVENAEMTLLLSPLALFTIIGRGFGEAINAEEIQYGRSYISDAIGESLASEELHIVDDALRIKGVGSRIFDAEGFPSQRTEIIKDGILKSVLHNSYTANKEEVNNTGNANRPSYFGVPFISPSNLVISPGQGTQEDLISEIDKGIFCRDTGDRPNMTTGDLSAMVMEGFYIEKGEIKFPVKNTLFGLHMRDLLKKLKRVGKDSRVITNVFDPKFTVISPSIVIESAKITSGE
ncbi:MAG: TldD/PmbA family protein [Promethearchaeota archaeon]